MFLDTRRVIWPRRTCSPSFFVLGFFFYNIEGKRFETESYEHLLPALAIVLEISVMIAQFPSTAIAELSMSSARWAGFANIGGPPMPMGLPPYASKKARAVRRADRDHDRRRLMRMPRWRGNWAPSPATRRTPNQMMRVIRNPRAPPMVKAAAMRRSRQSGAARFAASADRIVAAQKSPGTMHCRSARSREYPHCADPGGGADRHHWPVWIATPQCHRDDVSAW